METRANYILIGAFTLAVIAGGFLFVLWFTGLGRTADQKSYEIMFTGSVSGLSRGSQVLFNGLRVGEVKSIDFVVNDPSSVSAIITVGERTPVKTDTKARLEFQGLTGVAAIAMTGGSSNAPPLEAGRNGKPPVINAERSDFQNLLETAQHIAAKANDVLNKVDTLVDSNSGTVADTLHNLDAFSKALAQNSAGLNTFLASVSDVGKKMGPLSDKLAALSNDLDTVVKAVDPDQIRAVVGNVGVFTGTLAKNKDNIDAVLANAATLSARLTGVSQKLDLALDQFNALEKSLDPAKVQGAVDNVAAFAQTLGQDRGDVDRMLKNASELSAKLNSSADQIDGLLHSLQGVIGSPETQGAISQIGDAAKSVRQLADDLDTRTKAIAAGLTRFSNSGLREYESLAVDGRRAVNDLDHVLRSLSSNPSQIIFGAKPALPEYHGGQ